jgi:hypothetical protein
MSSSRPMPKPLYGCDPPSGSSEPRGSLYSTPGSLVGLPSGSSSQPSGTFGPC